MGLRLVIVEPRNSVILARFNLIALGNQNLGFVTSCSFTYVVGPFPCLRTVARVAGSPQIVAGASSIAVVAASSSFSIGLGPFIHNLAFAVAKGIVIDIVNLGPFASSLASVAGPSGFIERHSIAGRCRQEKLRSRFGLTFVD